MKIISSEVKISKFNIFTIAFARALLVCLLESLVVTVAWNFTLPDLFGIKNILIYQTFLLLIGFKTITRSYIQDSIMLDVKDIKNMMISYITLIARLSSQQIGDPEKSNVDKL